MAGEVVVEVAERFDLLSAELAYDGHPITHRIRPVDDRLLPRRCDLLNGFIRVANSTFNGNTSEESGGAIHTNCLSSTEIVNSILWGNTANGYDDELGGAGCYYVTFSDIQGGHSGTGNIDSDPLFLDPLTGDLHLGANSPAIDAADGDEAPATDLEGRVRWDDPAVIDTGVGTPTYVDMGAYELGQGSDPCDGITCDTPPSSFCADVDTLTVYDTPGTCTDGICDYTTHTEACEFGCADGACNPNPCDGVSCNEPPANVCEDADICDVAETCTGSGTFCPVDRFQPQTFQCSTVPYDSDDFRCTTSACGGVLEARHQYPHCIGWKETCDTDHLVWHDDWEVVEDCDSNSFCEADFSGGTCVTCPTGCTVDSCNPCIFYVDQNAEAGGDGSSWSMAFTTVQEGIDAANLTANPGAYCEVWVAAGEYYVYESTREDTIQLGANVEVYGGFSGAEVVREERDWDTNLTVLDGRDSNGGSSQVYTVVTGAGGSVLDGFVVQYGRSDDNSINSSQYGGGLFNNSADLVVSNCVFRSNYALSGGGIYNCVFRSKRSPESV